MVPEPSPKALRAHARTFLLPLPCRVSRGGGCGACSASCSWSICWNRSTAGCCRRCLRPVSEELQLTDVQAGWLATVLLASYAVWGPLVGYLAYGSRRPRLMAVGIAVWSLATVGTGLARSYNEASTGSAHWWGWEDRRSASPHAADSDGTVSPGRAGSLVIGLLPGDAAGCRTGLLAGARCLPRRPPGTWPSWWAGARGLVLALDWILTLPDPLRGTSEGVEEQRLRLHAASRPQPRGLCRPHGEFLVHLLGFFGLAFSMFAIGGLIVWLPDVPGLDCPPGPHGADQLLAGLRRAGCDGGGHVGWRLAGRPLFTPSTPGTVSGSRPGDAGAPFLACSMARTLDGANPSYSPALVPRLSPCSSRTPARATPSLPTWCCRTCRAVAYAVAPGGDTPAGRPLVAHGHGLGLGHLRPG